MDPDPGDPETGAKALVRSLSPKSGGPLEGTPLAESGGRVATETSPHIREDMEGGSPEDGGGMAGNA